MRAETDRRTDRQLDTQKVTLVLVTFIEQFLKLTHLHV